ncbi:PAS domain-containing protein [Desulfovibrio sp. OttesenSCG-928-O18]|nr:PAS domain-containing protein [Desulfovibrio sp. OttesenSCG-928-O18]
MREKITPPINPLISSYLPLVDFLGKLIGPHCEVVLHDLTSPERSVVAIANGYISGRAVGAPLTDFALRMLKEKTHAAVDFLHEYEGALKNGKAMRSSTFFIKDRDAQLVGLLCFNVDMSRLQGLHEELGNVLSAYFNRNGLHGPSDPPNGAVASPFPGAPVPSPVHFGESETFSESIEDLMNSSIAKAIAPYGLPPKRLSPAEREEVVETLFKKGFFQLRGAVEHVAAAFGLSDATIYRYLKSVQKRNA